MRQDGYCRSDAGQGQTFGGTAPFLSPKALLTSATAFAQARKEISGKHLFRLDCAKLATYFVILVRWDEMRSAASAMSMPWPIEHTKEAAYTEFIRVANNSAAADGAWYFSYDGPAIVPGQFDATGYLWQNVFNGSTGWCGSAIHAPPPDSGKCIYSWPNSSSHVPCCDSCGDHPRCECRLLPGLTRRSVLTWRLSDGLSNICMNYSAPGEGIVSTLPQYDLLAMPAAGGL